jgi:hypothetical protein
MKWIGHERSSKKSFWLNGNLSTSRLWRVRIARRHLALRCREDAAKAGISGQDLEAAVEGNLIGNMLQALDAAEFRQMYRDQVGDQQDCGSSPAALL